MLNVALVGLLAGSLALGTPGDDDDKKKKSPDTPAVENATPGVFETAQARSITTDTYAMGRPVASAPIKFWASYAYGEAESIYDVRGTDGELAVAGTNGDVVSQRVNVGAQINFVSFPAFSLGAGGVLTVAKNEFQAGSDPSPFTNGVGDLESDFGLQNAKAFVSARGSVVGVHAGYIFDLGEEGTDGDQARVNTPFGELPVSVNAQGDVQPDLLIAQGGLTGYSPIILPETIANSDGRDALNIGADFDYPSERFRLFGGVEYFNLFESEDGIDGDDIVSFMLGGGVKFSFVEIGAAAQIQTRHSNPTVENIGTVAGIGGHHGSLMPYLRISPPSLPASIFVKGAVQEEYTEFGYSLGGSNSVQPSIGFTAGLSVGFN